MTFKQQFDRLTEAYINGEVSPYRECSCFIGTLLQTGQWQSFRKVGDCVGDGEMLDKNQLKEYPQHNYKGFMPSIDHYDSSVEVIRISSDGTYTPQDILDMENLFLRTIAKNTLGVREIKESPFGIVHVRYHPNYEEALFKAFQVTLDLLKSIHERNGEDVEEQTFVKRSLVAA